MSSLDAMNKRALRLLASVFPEPVEGTGVSWGDLTVEDQATVAEIAGSIGMPVSDLRYNLRLVTDEQLDSLERIALAYVSRP